MGDRHLRDDSQEPFVCGGVSVEGTRNRQLGIIDREKFEEAPTSSLRTKGNPQRKESPGTLRKTLARVPLSVYGRMNKRGLSGLSLYCLSTILLNNQYSRPNISTFSSSLIVIKPSHRAAPKANSLLMKKKINIYIYIPQIHLYAPKYNYALSYNNIYPKTYSKGNRLQGKSFSSDYFSLVLQYY